MNFIWRTALEKNFRSLEFCRNIEMGQGGRNTSNAQIKIGAKYGPTKANVDGVSAKIVFEKHDVIIQNKR